MDYPRMLQMIFDSYGDIDVHTLNDSPYSSNVPQAFLIKPDETCYWALVHKK